MTDAESDPQLARSELETLRLDRAALAGVLAQREEFYRTVLDSLAEGVLITDEASRILHANRRMQDLTGWRPGELLGRVSYEVLAPPELWPAMRRRLDERLAGQEEEYENELVCKDGARRWVRVRASPYRNAAGQIAGTVGTLACIDRQKELERENEYLAGELREEADFGDIIGRSAARQKVLEQIAVVAPTQAGVLILGETGTGKELVARAIHEHSARRGRPLVRVNCAAVPKELFESEFFGHTKGAFTGALRDRVGRFELADGGTLFLDEVGEIPLELQAKLLRVLQEGQFERLGEARTRTVDVRILAATNRDLEAEARAGRFRQDLYFRLSVIPIALPPLRERREDILPLARHFVARTAARHGLPTPALTSAAIAELEAYDWPGNVRELQNVVERAVILARGGALRLGLTPAGSLPVRAVRRDPPPPAPGPAGLAGLRAQERDLIRDALAASGGRIYGPEGAAARLGLKPTTLTSKLRRWGWRRGTWETAA